MSDKLPALLPLAEVQTMAKAVAQSGLFGAKTLDQALALMLVAQAEGMHPMTAVQTYDIIDGKPAMKAQAMLARFQRAGGTVEWKARTSERACASFTHPQGGTVEVEWTIEMAKASVAIGRNGLKDNWRKFPRQMLTARVISEGVTTVYPAAKGGFYTPEEVQDFSPRDVNPRPSRRDLRPEPKITEVIDPETGEVITDAPKTSLDVVRSLPEIEKLAAQQLENQRPQENLATGKAQEPPAQLAPTAAFVDAFPPADDVGVLKQPELPPQSWDHWAREAHRAILTAKDVAALDDWCDANADIIMAFTNAHKDRGEKLQKFYVKRRGELRE